MGTIILLLNGFLAFLGAILFVALFIVIVSAGVNLFMPKFKGANKIKIKNEKSLALKFSFWLALLCTGITAFLFSDLRPVPEADQISNIMIRDSSGIDKDINGEEINGIINELAGGKFVKDPFATLWGTGGSGDYIHITIDYEKQGKKVMFITLYSGGKVYVQKVLSGQAYSLIGDEDMYNKIAESLND